MRCDGCRRAAHEHGAFERRLELPCRLEPLRGRRRDRTFDRAHERRRQIRARVAETGARPARMGVANLVQRSAADGEVSADHVEEQHPQAVDIRARVGGTASEHLGGHVERRARHRGPALGRRQPLVVPRAEIHQHDPPAVLAHHVAGGDVAMEQAGRVHGRQRPAQVEPHAGRLARAERPLLLDQLLQRAPADELHPDADHAVARLGAVDRDHVRMAHARQQPPFVDDPRRVADRLARRVRRRVCPQQFERHVAVEMRIPRAIHVAVGAVAEQFQPLQVTPHRQMLTGRFCLGPGHGGKRQPAAAAMQRGDLGQHVELADDLAVALVARRVGRRPVDRRALEDGGCQDAQPRLSIHVPSPLPA